VTVQFPLSAGRILTSLWFINDFRALDSALVMFDIKGFVFSNNDLIFHLNSMPTTGGVYMLCCGLVLASSNFADLSSHFSLLLF
jgi:hypothetical protein